jgi:hypothetical protein
MKSYGMNMDIHDITLENAKYPEQVIEQTKEHMLAAFLHQAKIQGWTATEPTEWRQWRNVVEPFDYEDEDGTIQHSEGYQCTRIEWRYYQEEE